MEIAYFLSWIKCRVLRWLPATTSIKDTVMVENDQGDFLFLNTEITVSDSVFWRMRKHHIDILARLFPQTVRILIEGQLYLVSGKKVTVPSQNVEYEVNGLLTFRFFDPLCATFVM